MARGQIDPGMYTRMLAKAYSSIKGAKCQRDGDQRRAVPDGRGRGLRYGSRLE